MSTFPQITSPPQTEAGVLVNRALETLEHQAVYGLKHSTTTGLSWGYYGGRWGGFAITDGVLTLTDASANYIVVEIASGDISVDTASTDWDDDTNYVRVYKVTTVGGVVTAVEDHRAGPGGVHGGAGGGGGGALDDLSDVNAGSPSDGQVLTWDAGSSMWTAQTPAEPGSGNQLSANSTPAQLAFTRIHQADFADMLPAALVEFDEGFVSDSGQFRKQTEGTAHTFSVTGGQLVLTNSAGAARNDVISEGSDLTIPQVFVQIDVVTRSGTPTGYDNIGVGIVKDSNNFVFAALDRIAGTCRIQLKIGGSNTFNSSVSKALGSGPYKIGFSLVANSACMYVDTGSGWEYVTGYAIPTGTINFKSTSLTDWRAGFTQATSGAGGTASWTYDNFKSGRFGGVGIRDFSLVTNEDGSTYVEGTSPKYVYLCASLADGLGASSQGVVKMSLSDYSIAVTAIIMIERSGSKYNDLAGHIIYYGNGDRRITIPTWGNGFGGVIDLWGALITGADILNGSHLLTTLAKLNVPQPASYGAYDPFLIKDESTWRMAYSLTTATSFAGSPFYAASASSSDLSTWTATGDDRTTRPYEGTKFIDFLGSYYILAGGPSRSVVYDKYCNYRGQIQATFDGGTSTQPHPMMFEVPDEDRFLMVTFDQEKVMTGVTATFTWGRFIVQEATYVLV